MAAQVYYKMAQQLEKQSEKLTEENKLLKELIAEIKKDAELPINRTCYNCDCGNCQSCLVTLGDSGVVKWRWRYADEVEEVLNDE